jgi:hypothetical protein
MDVGRCSTGSASDLGPANVVAAGIGLHEASDTALRTSHRSDGATF